ncbi:hypothetical protein B7L29_036780, partial [Burkholderia cenocepacia]|uniref:IS4 family transposase n=1 Tax=Burkholderia cenocepacia TaxID=95486 RepID=UPI0022383074
IDRAHDPRSWARSHVILTELPKLSHHAPCAREYGTGRAEPLTLVARLGGFLARKSDGEPGAETIWKGLTKVHIAAETMRLLRDDGDAGTSV